MQPVAGIHSSWRHLNLRRAIGGGVSSSSSSPLGAVFEKSVRMFAVGMVILALTSCRSECQVQTIGLRLGGSGCTHPTIRGNREEAPHHVAYRKIDWCRRAYPANLMRSCHRPVAPCYRKGVLVLILLDPCHLCRHAVLVLPAIFYYNRHIIESRVMANRHKGCGKPLDPPVN